MYLKRYCTPKKQLIIFFQLKHLQKYDLKKICISQSRQDQKLCQFLFFCCDVIFDKLPKLGQISCVILYYIEIKDSSYLGKFFVKLL